MGRFIYGRNNLFALTHTDLGPEHILTDMDQDSGWSLTQGKTPNIMSGNALPQKITSSARLLLQVILDNQDPQTGMCTMSNQQISKTIGIGTTAICYTLRKLSDKYVIVTYPTPSTRSIYLIGGHTLDSNDSKSGLKALGIKHPTLFV